MRQDIVSFNAAWTGLLVQEGGFILGLSKDSELGALPGDHRIYFGRRADLRRKGRGLLGFALEGLAQIGFLVRQSDIDVILEVSRSHLVYPCIPK